MADAKNNEVGTRSRMFRPIEPASGDFPVLDEKGRQVYNVEGQTSLPDPEDPENPEKRIPVTKDTPRARPSTTPWVINPGDLFAEDHPIVEGWPHLFREVDLTREKVEAR